MYRISFYKLFHHLTITWPSLTHHAILTSFVRNHTRANLTSGSADDDGWSLFIFSRQTYPTKHHGRTLSLSRYMRTEVLSTSSPKRLNYVQSKVVFKNIYIIKFLGNAPPFLDPIRIFTIPIIRPTISYKTPIFSTFRADFLYPSPGRFERLNYTIHRTSHLLLLHFR
jgi:hypothetical protein